MLPRPDAFRRFVPTHAPSVWLRLDRRADAAVLPGRGCGNARLPQAKESILNARQARRPTRPCTNVTLGRHPPDYHGSADDWRRFRLALAVSSCREGCVCGATSPRLAESKCSTTRAGPAATDRHRSGVLFRTRGLLPRRGAGQVSRHGGRHKDSAELFQRSGLTAAQQCAFMRRMTTTRSSKPGSRSSRKVAAKATAKRPAAKKPAAKAGGSLRGIVRVSASARAELTGLLDRIHRNIDETEALLAG